MVKPVFVSQDTPSMIAVILVVGWFLIKFSDIKLIKILIQRVNLKVFQYHFHLWLVLTHFVM